MGLQYRNNRQLNILMDQLLPWRVRFTRRSYALGGEKLDMYMRNSLDVLKDLYGRPDFARDLIFAPEKHYLVVDGPNGSLKKRRTYHDMHTGTWWWGKQVRR